MEVGRAGSRQEPGRVLRPCPSQVPGRQFPAEPGLTRHSWLRKKTKSLQIRVRFAPGKRLCVAEPALAGAAQCQLRQESCSPDGAPWAGQFPRGDPSTPCPFLPGRWQSPHLGGGCPMAPRLRSPLCPGGSGCDMGAGGLGAAGREQRAGRSRTASLVLSAGGTAGCRT